MRSPDGARDAPAATSLGIRVVRVPLPVPIRTAAGSADAARLLLIDLAYPDGVVGRSYVQVYSEAVLGAAAVLLRGLDGCLPGPAGPGGSVARRLRAALALDGARGAAAVCVGAVDLAEWDAAGQRAGQPVAALLGATRTAVRAYATLRSVEPAELEAEAGAAIAAGFRAVKVKLGLGGASADVAALRAVRAAAPDARLMVDFNRALQPADAPSRIGRLEPFGLEWVEDPLAGDDAAELAELGRVIGPPLQGGEDCESPDALSNMVRHAGSSLCMANVARIGGVSGWVDAARRAAAARAELSSHAYPEASAHLLAAAPMSGWLEHTRAAAPVLEAPAEVGLDGMVQVGQAPGLGLTWNEPAVRRFEVG